MYDKLVIYIEENNVMDLDNYKESLSWLNDDEKIAYLQQESSFPDFAGQTNGQALYKYAVDMVDKQHRRRPKQSLKKFMTEHHKMITNTLKDIVGETCFPAYMADLEKQREIRAEQIMAQTEHLYHFSQVPPEEFGEHLIPTPQQKGNALSEKIGKSLCYATAIDEAMYMIKPPSNELKKDKGVCGHTDERLVMVFGHDPEKFIGEQALSYCYEVDKSSFKPNVSLDGNFTNEYESTTKARIIGIKGPFSIMDMCNTRTEGGWDVPVYFCPRSRDKESLMQRINELRGLGATKRDAFLQTSREHPDKLIYFNENKKLKEFARQQKIEQIKPEKKQQTEKASEVLRQKYEADKLKNIIAVKRGFQNPKNRKAVNKAADEKLRKTGKTLTDKDIRLIKVKIAGKGK